MPTLRIFHTYISKIKYYSYIIAVDRVVIPFLYEDALYSRM